MTKHEVHCIRKSDRYSPHERIREIGGRNGDGSGWHATQEQAIAWIEAGRYNFFVRNGGREVRVIVDTT